MKYILIIYAILISTIAYSQNPPNRGGVFKQYDKNNDKKISLQEFQLFYQKTNSSVKFSILDSNKDNFLDRQDFKSLVLSGKGKKKDSIFELD